MRVILLKIVIMADRSLTLDPLKIDLERDHLLTLDKELNQMQILSILESFRKEPFSSKEHFVESPLEHVFLPHPLPFYRSDLKKFSETCFDLDGRKKRYRDSECVFKFYDVHIIVFDSPMLKPELIIALTVNC